MSIEKRGGEENSPQLVLILFQTLQRLWEYTPHRTPTHLDPQILPVRFTSAPRDLSIVHAETADIAPRAHEIKARPQRVAMAHALNDGIRAPAVRQLLHARDQALLVLLVVPGLGTEGLCLGEARVDAVDGQHDLRLVLEGVDERAQPDGPAADQHHDRLADGGGVEAAERIGGREVARGEDVGHQHEQLLVHAGGRFHRRGVGERHAQEVRLPAVEARRAEEEAARAARREAVLAVETRAAGDGEGHDDVVADFVGFDGRADLDD